jgi:hypothetical protein
MKILVLAFGEFWAEILIYRESRIGLRTIGGRQKSWLLKADR